MYICALARCTRAHKRYPVHDYGDSEGLGCGWRAEPYGTCMPRRAARYAKTLPTAVHGDALVQSHGELALIPHLHEFVEKPPRLLRH